MAIALDNILQITLNQTYLTKACANVFYYKAFSITGTPTYAEVASNFAISVLDDVNAMQSQGVQNVSIVIKNLTNGLDISENINSATGDIAGESLPAFNAWGFKLVRTTALTRHGSKRFVGVAETSIAGETPSAALLLLADAVEADLSQVIVVDGVSGDVSLRPMIIGRVLNTTTGQYELDITKQNIISAAQFTGITSQTSRKD